MKFVFNSPPVYNEVMDILGQKTIKKIQKILAKQPDILPAYLFGSQEGTYGY